MIKKTKKILLLIIMLFIYIPNVSALTGIVNVNDSLTLRNRPTTSGTYITSFYNGTELTILNTNAGSGNGCPNNWYQVKYGNYTGYSCGTYINLVSENTNNSGQDDTYNKNDYNESPSKDGTIMCYEDTGAITLRSSANGNRLTGKTVNCGEEVNIISTTETKGASCPYWYKVNNGKYEGHLCGYFVNTTKLSSTAEKYYNNKTNGDTIANYKAKLTSAGFPESYHSYLLEIHARYPRWNFVAEKINLTFDEVITGESGNGASLLEWSAFDEGYISTASHSYNILTNKFIGYESEPGYYNASEEAIAYYLDPRNYLNEKYIFAFETLGYSNNQTTSVVSSIISGQKFFNTIYSKTFSDSTGSASGDIVKASSSIGISAVHVASRIKQEMGNSLTTSDSRLGGSFSYNGTNRSGYYNFFNIKSSCKNCSSIYSGYAYEKGWNTPYKGIYGGSNFMYSSYISLNQDTLYYEKFDVSTTNGNYTHQYMQNLAATVQEGGIKYKGYVESFASYLDTAITFVIPVYKNMPEHAVTAPKLGNPNNYLKNLTVNGNSVSNFSYNTYNYNVYLDKNTTSVSLGAIKIVNEASLQGTGTIAIKSDNQTNQIIVTSENGKTRTYTINFIRETMEKTTVTDTMNNSGFKYNEEYLFGINIGTNVSQIIGNISNYNHSVEVVVKDKDGNKKTNDNFKTGDKVTVTGSDGSKTYTVLIYGDANGDGKISAVDYVNIKNYIMKSSKLTGAYLEAADVNKDGKVTAVDYVQIKNNIMGKSKITQ